MTKRQGTHEGKDPLASLLRIDPEIPLGRIITILRATRPRLYCDRPLDAPTNLPPGVTKVEIFIKRAESKRCLFNPADRKMEET
ncbi:MAG TPA: hypothetical protein VLA89_15490 [Gemmatimonadales bacterium]|nr:hypothetical protein [Gemmatimonadales bacterium]